MKFLAGSHRSEASVTGRSTPQFASFASLASRLLIGHVKFTCERMHLNRVILRQECKARAQAMLTAALLSRSVAAGEEGDEETQRPLTKQETKSLLLPLLRLRQACCHPQVFAPVSCLGFGV